MITRILPSARKHQRGQALVEFTLMLPIFLMLLLGLVATAIIFYSYVTTQFAVREGASAIVRDPNGQTVAGIQALVKTRSFTLDPNGMSVLVEPDASLWFPGVHVAVTAVYNVPLPKVSIALPGGATFSLGPIPVKAWSVMTIE
jgi:hypothetical protein